jgi:hypothetical protein
MEQKAPQILRTIMDNALNRTEMQVIWFRMCTTPFQKGIFFFEKREEKMLFACSMFRISVHGPRK